MLALQLALAGAACGGGSVVDVPASPGALNRAVDAVAAAASPAARGGPGGNPNPVTLRLAAGRHQLLRPLELSPAHSGLAFVGSPEGASVISGGIEIDPAAWKPFAAAACKGCGQVMRAPLPAGTKYSRQLYVGGVRANWTTALFPQEGATVTATGYAVPAAAGLNWSHNKGGLVEMVYRGTKSSGAQWTESRTPVQSYGPGLLPGHHHITMAAAGFAAGRNKAYNQHLGLPEYYQNAFELLGAARGGRPGDFYLDLPLGGGGGGGGGFVYFVTAADTVATSATAAPLIKAVLPQLELLVNATAGTAGLSWTDVTFAEATWLLPR
eukprot:SAG22_NODE_1108_length_5550_cov_4.655109_5_plen_325_part_00